MAALDLLGLENSIARARTLIYLAMTAIKLLEERLNTLEAAVNVPRYLGQTVFDTEPNGGEFSAEVAVD